MYSIQKHTVAFKENPSHFCKLSQMHGDIQTILNFKHTRDDSMLTGYWLCINRLAVLPLIILKTMR